MNKLDIFLKDLDNERKAKKITREDLAKHVGKSVSTINNVFRGSNGSLETIRKIVEYIENN